MAGSASGLARGVGSAVYAEKLDLFRAVPGWIFIRSSIEGASPYDGMMTAHCGFPSFSAGRVTRGEISAPIARIPTPYFLNNRHHYLIGGAH